MSKKKTLQYGGYTHRALVLERRRAAAIAKKFPYHKLPLYALRLRDSTLENSVESLQRKKPYVKHFYKTSPLSMHPNFQHLRHGRKKCRLIRQRGDKAYPLNPQSPVYLIESNKFKASDETVYGYGHTVITIRTPGGTRDMLRPLEEIRTRKTLTFEEADQLPFEKQVSTVSLSYNQLARPAKENRRISNRQVQGGLSADDLFEEQFDTFKNRIVEMGLASEEDLDECLESTQSLRHEHTHLIASHFGKLRTQEGQILSPINKDSTFVGTEHLNTEMMLFEKFVDFLLYINHKKHRHPAHEKTVDYSCKVLFTEEARIPVGLQLKIVDKHTGIEFVQTWNDPYRVVEKPSAQMYTRLLTALKAGLDRRLKV